MALRSRAGVRAILISGVLAAGAVIALRAPVGRAFPSQASSGQQKRAKPAAPPTIPPYTIKVQRNLVMIRAVVRNPKGELVDGLTQDDFRILDNGKPQEITEFSVRRAATETKVPIAQASPVVSGHPSAPAPPAAQPPAPRATHFIGFYFDDNHLNTRAAVQARLAAEKFLAASWRPGDYAGVFTATGATTLDFTRDLTRIHKTIAGINARPPDESPFDCPYLTPYQAYLIAERRDENATEIAVAEAMQCTCGQGVYGPPVRGCKTSASTIAWDTAVQIWNHTRYQSQVTLSGAGAVIERMAGLPGERTLAFVSPGLITAPEDEQVGHLIDLALRDQVTIGSLDARGLYTLGPKKYMRFGRRSMTNPADIAGLTRNAGNPAAQKMGYLHTEASVADDPLAELAEGTGGTFFWNNNDLVEGFKEVTSEAAVEYLMGFSPDDMKPNGAYHSVKVKITAPGKYQIQARKGYYAPTKAEEARASITNPIESAVYTNSLSQPFPVAISARSAKAGRGRATVSVTIHVGIGSLDFRAKHGQHEDTLVFRTALLSPAGEQITGDERTLPLKLDAARFASLSRTGIFAVTKLDAPPGNYTLREVVEEKGTGKLSSVSQAIEVH